jgi:NhaA family Na+:H+ antiporter
MTDEPATVDQAGGTYSLRTFIHNEAFGGILLLACVLVAMIWANSPWADAYTDLWHATVTVGSDRLHISESLQHWINDGLMAIFFLVVGLEIKREVLVGELASVSQAAMPVFAAVGGAIVPALIYLALNWGAPGVHGWGTPMATDIAFALGVLALLGNRVPVALKVFLTALAIVDDILAVLVIAVFYTDRLDLAALAGAAVVIVALIAANRLGVRNLAVYLGLGLVLWICVRGSGIHATVAGILLALTIPTSTRIDPAAFVDRIEAILGRFERESLAERNVLTDGRLQEKLQELEDAVDDVQAPLQKLEHILHPWVAFAIVPLFALANAGVVLDVRPGDLLTDRVSLGIILGLVLGKQVGITCFAWLATRLGLGTLPSGVTWRQIYALSWLGGIGFTMSLFISDLAFDDEALLTSARIGILAASTIAGLVGWLVLGRWALARDPVGSPE